MGGFFRASPRPFCRRPRPVSSKYSCASCPKTQTNSRPARRGRFDRHQPVASPRYGGRRRCRRFEFPVRAGKIPSSNGMPRSRTETWIQARAVPGPERALLHGPEQIADLPVPVVESPGAVRIGHPERGHLVEYLAPNSVFNSLPRQRSCPHLGPDDRFVTIDRVLHHASRGVA